MTTETRRLRWGIIGPGAIAKSFAKGLADSRLGTLAAIGTRDPARAGLAADFAGARIVAGYDALLADPGVEAVYIATPHPGHAEWAIKAAEAGKHVLVEKPMALSAFEAAALQNAAQKAGTFLGEAFMYRLHPMTARLVELVRSGAIGEVRMVKSSFGFAMPRVMPEHRLYANDLAGGGILDVGGYPVSMARLVAGAATGRPFADPDIVRGVAHLGVTGVDEWASAVLHFPGGIVAEVSCSVSLAQENVLRILGTEGRIEVRDFWFAGGNRDGGPGEIDIVRRDGARETVAVPGDRHLYAYESDAAAEAILAGRREFAAPGMSWADSLGNLRVLDKWRADAGLVFGIETPAKRKVTLANRPLAPRGPQLERASIGGLDKPASRIALGFEYFPDFASASIQLDRFFERGGNLFDTAWVYGAGKTESNFGDWHTSRGLDRADLVVIGKGAHSPLCYPDVIARQLDQTLERLRTDHVDVYFMHRDNPDVPVGEFVDAMDAEVRRGRIRGPFGGSNWTRARFDEAIAYARVNGRQAPAVLSNNYALAEMLDPIWDGCVAASDDPWKAWLADRKITNFSWSSQARGFFTDRAGRDRRDDPELVRVWYNDTNFARRDRAIEFARRIGRSPIHVALAWVLAQPTPVVPLIGPRSLDELEDSISALDIRLTPAQVRWLEGGEGTP